jgi:hypothetical protein
MLRPGGRREGRKVARKEGTEEGRKERRKEELHMLQAPRWFAGLECAIKGTKGLQVSGIAVPFVPVFREGGREGVAFIRKERLDDLKEVSSRAFPSM